MVQCENCQSIVNFIEAEPSEEPIVFNIDKCSKCNGTIEDEKKVHAVYYPDAFI